jgi:hypothetical protein
MIAADDIIDDGRGASSRAAQRAQTINFLN